MEISLNNGFKMPMMGLGVAGMRKDEIKDIITNAIQIGYRHFDCAADYKNEAEVGEALAEALESGLVKREELFITSKLWNSDHGHVVEACKDSLKKLQLQYLDLYLVHFPIPTKHTVKPAVNQIETHPYFQRESLVRFCQKHEICVTAHTPLGGAAVNPQVFGSIYNVIQDPLLEKVANKYGRSPAQIALRWGIQRNTVVIPKSSKLKRLEENFQVFDFELKQEDMDLIKNIDKKYRTNLISTVAWGIDIYA
ncbi:NADP-dependent D-sorbitol-6-phosphate dehydrogenase-like isoform X3 [Cucumis melo]|uniref:NADP-dependent D-sorbitol-6-phosphate dehydrogenase-like isoform X3 n=1 Tax=Cucumis melo TaxID=3656 RepID=A0A1S3BNJ1_CUCME|nr:NADP-dependent D-sorbitol-6-phosphate dehydrogenase-like isoform X3 [Cucumis melo]